MFDGKTGLENELDLIKPADTEIALDLIGYSHDIDRSTSIAGNKEVRERLVIRTAEAMETMTNPFAKNLLRNIVFEE